MNKIIALLLIICLQCPTIVFAETFNDVLINDKYYQAINYLTDKSILQGVSYDIFGITDTVSRGDMSVILHRALIHIADSYFSYSSDINFSDYNDIAAYAEPSIETLHYVGIIEVDTSNKFRPNDDISYIEALQFIVNALGDKKAAFDAGGLPSGYKTIALNKGILNNISITNDSQTLTKGDVAQFIYNMIQCYYQGSYDLYVESGRVYLDNNIKFIVGEPLCGIRTISDNLYLYATWNEEYSQVTYSRGNDALVMTMSKNQYTFNSETKLMSVPPQIIDGRIYIPIKVITENFGYKLHVDHLNGNVIIYSNEQVPILQPTLTMNGNEYIKNPDSDNDIFATIKYNYNSLLSIKNSEIELYSPQDFSVIGNTIAFKKEYLRTLPNGVNTINLYFTDNFKLNAIIRIINNVIVPQNSNYNLYADGDKISTDAPLCLVNDEIFAPPRALAESIGCTVYWNQELYQITFFDYYKTIVMQLDSETYSSNGTNKTMSVPIFLHNGRTFVPIEVIAKEFGATYYEDTINQRIIIETPDIKVTNITQQDGTALRLDTLKGLTSAKLTILSKIDNYYCDFAFACYDKDGKLTYIKTEGTTLGDSTTNTMTFTLDNLPSDICSIKIINLDSMNSMQPVRDVISIPNVLFYK